MILHGDCLEQLKTLEANSIDSIVTDPPYGLSFMGKKWDYDVPSVDVWRQALRVLKPGGHLLSFAGTRTYHRMACNIEDAGFEIRDQIMWLYGSGFPKSHNLKDEWQGWGSALKPANEPIVVARKPLEKGLTLAANVLKYGCGALNIDASRIATDEQLSIGSGKLLNGLMGGKGANGSNPGEQHPSGRWPANVLLDEEAAAVLDEQSGDIKSAGKYKTPDSAKEGGNGMFAGGRITNAYAGETGGASRFFYVAKASKRERGTENNHPTVKPIKLMEYLIKLVTQPNGTVLDPFMGSGTTGVAAKKTGFNFIGIEREAEYVAIAERRIEASA